MKILFTLTILLLVFSAMGEQQVPLRKAPYGFTIGDPKGSMQITFFIDLLCPDSRDSYNTWIQVRRAIDLYQQGIKITYQFNPLTWHFYSLKITQAFFYVLQKGGSSQAQKFISYIFTNQQSFAEQNFMDKSINQFLDFLADRISILNRVDRQDLRNNLQAGNDYANNARQHWKFTTGANGVAAAPVFNLYGVRIDGAEDFQTADWIKFIQTYKNSNKQLNFQ